MIVASCQHAGAYLYTIQLWKTMFQKVAFKDRQSVCHKIVNYSLSSGSSHVIIGSKLPNIAFICLKAMPPSETWLVARVKNLNP